MTEPRTPIFDKSHKEPGIYCCVLKSGVKIIYTQRSEIWFDKARCQFVTFHTADHVTFESIGYLRGISAKELLGNGFVYDVDEVDIRFNDISAIWELNER